MSISLPPVRWVSIKLGNEMDGQIYFSSPLIERLGIDKNHNIQMIFGRKQKRAAVQALPNDHEEILLPEAVFHELSLPVRTKTKFLVRYFPANHSLYLGPVVGLLTDSPSNLKKEPLFGSIHTFCEELQQIMTEIGGLFYVFSCEHFSEEGVEGYYFENGNWIFSKLPLPDVIYNRVHSRKLEQLPKFTSLRSTLEHMNIPFFNDRFLSKWEVHQHLMQEEQIHPYIPETHIFTDETLHHFIEKYDSIFIKPDHGSQGKNIFKLIKEADDILCLTSQSPITAKYKNDEIFYQLKPQLTNKIYIIQQGVQLAEHHERVMDFRVLVHKNQHHLWEVTSLVARISAKKQFVPNLAKGGEVMKPFNALQTCFTKEHSLKIISAMKELALKTASAVSRHAKGITGELGIDIGVDQIGNPWIIEVNSKPSKNFEDALAKVRPSAKAIIQFCIKLAFDGTLEWEDKI